MNKRGNLRKGILAKNYRGQVWVETVIYLLIAFVMMGLILSFIRPRIEELRDKVVIERSLEIIKDIDNLIITMENSGNKRLVEIGISKGSLIIDSENDEIIFEMDSRYLYTEPGQDVHIGNILALTETRGDNSKITLRRDFSEEYNLTYNGKESLKTLSKASIPYKLFFTNEGELYDKIIINFETE